MWQEREKWKWGVLAFDNPDVNQFESVELIQQDAESLEDAISVVFLPS